MITEQEVIEAAKEAILEYPDPEASNPPDMSGPELEFFMRFARRMYAKGLLAGAEKLLSIGALGDGTYIEALREMANSCTKDQP